MAGREKERKTWRSTRTHTLAEIDECRGGVGKKLKVETKSAQDRSKGGGAETQRLSGSLFRAFFFRTCHSFVLFCLIIFKNLVQVSNITTTIHTTGTWSWKGAWIVNTADRGTYGRRLSRSWTCHGDCKTLRPGTWTRLVRDLLMCCLLSREFRNPHEKKGFLSKTDRGYPTDADFTGERQRRGFSSMLPRAKGSQPKSGYLFERFFSKRTCIHVMWKWDSATSIFRVHPRFNLPRLSHPGKTLRILSAVTSLGQLTSLCPR